MDEVYQARDTKLDRDVALKVLPEASLAQKHLFDDLGPSVEPGSETGAKFGESHAGSEGVC